MKRLLVFDGSPAAGVIFASLHLALRLGRAQQTNPPGRKVLRQERDLARLMEKIGEPDPEKVEDLICRGCGRVVLPREPKAIRLAAAGGRIEISQDDLELLQERIDKGFWSGDTGFEMADAADFLGAAPELKDTPAPAPGPRALPASGTGEAGGGAGA